MQKLRMVLLTQQYVDQASDILARNFTSYNPIWKKYNLDENQIRALMRGKVIKALQIDQSFVGLQGNKMFGLSIHMDMLDYMEYPVMPTNLQFSKKLQTVTKQLDGLVDLSNIKRGEYIYGVFGVIDMKYVDKGYLTYFYWLCLAIFKASGWKHYYGRCSNMATAKVLQKMGAKQIAQYNLLNENQVQKFILMKLDFQNFNVLHRNIKKLIQSKNKNKKIPAKL